MPSSLARLGVPLRHARPWALPWNAALRAGLYTYLGATLVISLLLGSLWAGQTNFPGHQHAPGTPEHHHALLQVLGAPSLPTATAVSANDRILEYGEPLLWIVWLGRVQTRGSALARAPPGVRRPARPSAGPGATPHRLPRRQPPHREGGRSVTDLSQHL